MLNVNFITNGVHEICYNRVICSQRALVYLMLYLNFITDRMQRMCDTRENHLKCIFVYLMLAVNNDRVHERCAIQARESFVVNVH